MRRRDFIAFLAMLYGGGAAADLSVPDLIYRNNPGWLKLYFKRFWIFRNQHFFDLEKAWPKSLTAALFEDMDRPRDFLQTLPDERTNPRFQFIFEADGKEPLRSSAVEWFDLENPARLRALWLKSFPRAPKDNWCGVGYDVAEDQFAYHYLDAAIPRDHLPSPHEPFERFGIRTRNFVGTKEAEGSQTYFVDRLRRAQTFRGTKLLWRHAQMNPFLPIRDKAVITEARFKILTEFHLRESAYANSADGQKQRIYYP